MHKSMKIKQIKIFRKSICVVIKVCSSNRFAYKFGLNGLKSGSWNGRLKL